MAFGKLDRPAGDLPLSDAWLLAAGFQMVEPKPIHWVLWCDIQDGSVFSERIGIEVANWYAEGWYLWIRSDSVGERGRFVFVRSIKTRWELKTVIEGLTFQEWNPAVQFEEMGAES